MKEEKNAKLYFITICVNFRNEEVNQQSKYIIMQMNIFAANHLGYKFRHIMPLEIESSITSQEWPYVKVRKVEESLQK